MGKRLRNSHNPRRFRKHGLARFAVAWAAVLLQLHLVFIIEFHHHAADFLTGSQSQRPAVEQASQVGRTTPLDCPACQIARHGAAQPATASSLVVSIPQQVKAPPSVELTIIFPSLFVPAGRAPPLS